jgi:hypothetical protein
MLKDDLAQFTGTNQYYQHKLIGNVFWTDGIQYLIIKAKCPWLIDLIASYQVSDKLKRNKMLQEFQLWELTTSGDEEIGRSAILTCRVDKGSNTIIKEKLPDARGFPMDYIELFVECSSDRKTILLPSEH